MDFEVAANCRCRLGESPTWHASSGSLFWADIIGGSLFRLPPRGAHEVVATGVLIAGLSVQEDDSLLALGSSGTVLTVRSGRVDILRRRSPRWTGYRFNDCITDPAGRVIAGIMREPVDLSRWRTLSRLRRQMRRLRMLPRSVDDRGYLSRIAPDGRTRTLLSDLRRPNGMAFSPRADVLYVTESGRCRILAFPYDLEHGTLGSPTVLIDDSREAGTPDGLVTDSEGCLWSARHKGGLIIRYAPDGRPVARLQLPTPGVTSLTFGGAAGNELYVTTARTGRDQSDDLAGAVFRIRTDAVGSPVYRSNVGVPRAAQG